MATYLEDIRDLYSNRPLHLPMVHTYYVPVRHIDWQPSSRMVLVPGLAVRVITDSDILNLLLGTSCLTTDLEAPLVAKKTACLLTPLADGAIRKVCRIP